MSQVIMTAEMLEWLKQFDALPNRKDSKADLIWKAAQRDIYERAKHLHEQQVHGTLHGSQKSAKQKGIKVRRED